jgi:hypothetical protein
MVCVVFFSSNTTTCSSISRDTDTRANTMVMVTGYQRDKSFDHHPVVTGRMVAPRNTRQPPTRVCVLSSSWIVSSGRTNTMVVYHWDNHIRNTGADLPRYILPCGDRYCKRCLHMAFFNVPSIIPRLRRQTPTRQNGLELGRELARPYAQRSLPWCLRPPCLPTRQRLQRSCDQNSSRVSTF